MRRLIVNADDFGLTPGVNLAIAEAHRRGIVTSTTLMANGRYFDGAVALARTMPRLAVGCHAVLVDGEPISPHEQVSTLLAQSQPKAQFPASFGAITRKVLSRRLTTAEVELEVTAQIQRLQHSGLTVTHVDSHKHVHMLPLIAEAIIRAATACGVRAIRNPFVAVKPLALLYLLRRPDLWTRYTGTKVLRGYSGRFRRLVAEAGMATTDGSFGVVSTGALDMELFRAIAGCIPEGTWEFVCHPGYVDPSLGQVRTRLRQSREKELAILASEEACRTLSENGIELISYRELTANQ